MKRITVLVMMLVAVPMWAHAKPAQELVDAVQNMFPSPSAHKGLLNSQHRLEMSKVNGFAVIKKPGIPAGTAFWFITKQHYDFRPFIVKGDSASTFFGKPDVVLEPGTVMVVAATEVFGKTVQIKLLSVDVISDRGQTPTRSDTRAAVAMTFKFPELSMKAVDTAVILDKVQEFIIPATSLAQANQISAALGSGIMPVAAKHHQPKSENVAAPTAVAPTTTIKEVPVDQLPQVSPAGTVRAGMNYDEVKKIKGAPLSTFTRGGDVVFDYNDHEVIFEHDKVVDVRWK